MFKIFVLAAVASVVVARPQESHGHGHGHAVSTQSIVLHASHGHEQHHAQAHHGHEEHHAQAHHGHHQDHHHDYYAHPKYEFEYKVSDPHTKDHKYQHEARDGDHVTGVYSLHEPDGTVRVVKYSADKHSGFNADVHHEGHATHVVPEKHHHHH